MKQTLNGQTIYSVYGLDGTLYFRDNITTGETTDYIRMGSHTVGRMDAAGAFTWTHGDHLGSASAATNAAGAILWRESYTPFGEVLEDPAANRDEAGFTGHIRDHATGLTYAQARYYNPVTARFLAPDPVGFADRGPGYFNRYAYTMNDPVNLVDPDGRDPCSLDGCSGQGSVGLVDQGSNQQQIATHDFVLHGSVDFTLATPSDGGADIALGAALEMAGGALLSGVQIQVTYNVDGAHSVDGEPGLYSLGANAGGQFNDFVGFNSAATTTNLDAVLFSGALTHPSGPGNRGAGLELGLGLGAGLATSETRTDPVIAVRAPWSPGFPEHGWIQAGPTE